MSINLPAALGPNINHAFRSTRAIALVETLLGTGEDIGPRQRANSWIDIGCGTGRFANSVNPRRFGVETWEIVGCDQQEGKIAVGEPESGREVETLLLPTLSQPWTSIEKRDESFHLVSMFEFLEHIDDPLRFMRQLMHYAPKFVLAASPLEQKMRKPLDATPDRAHLWSFSRRGWEQMFDDWRVSKSCTARRFASAATLAVSTG